jgi:hypothetical protein
MQGMHVMRMAAVGAQQCSRCAVTSSVVARSRACSAATSKCAAPTDVAVRALGLKYRAGGHIWHTPDGAHPGRRFAGLRLQHSRAQGDNAGGNASRGQQAWKIACGAGVLAGLAIWQSQQRVLAEAEVPASVLPQVGGSGQAARMSADAVRKALDSSNAETLKPALAALVLLAEDSDIDNTQAFITMVASKRVLGLEDGSVRAAAVSAIAALVASDDKAAAAALPGLVKGGTVAVCQKVLADRAVGPDALVRAATLFAYLSTFTGSWLAAGAHKSAGYMEAIVDIARLAAEPSLGVEARLAMVGTLGKVVGSKDGGGLGAAGAAGKDAISAISLVLMPSRAEDAALKSAALAVLSSASKHASLLPLVASSPASEAVLGMAASEAVGDAVASLEAAARMIRLSRASAERLCVDSGAVQLLVQAAAQHRTCKEMWEAVAGCLEALIASNSDDCRMHVAHFATPVVLALARVPDEYMQMRALRMVQVLCLNTFNKFNMQKSFSVIHDLVPLLARSDVRQLEIVTESLAHLASTDNAMYGENARALGEARAMKPLMVLARSKHHVVHRNATWALACMTAHDKNHVKMRASIDTLLTVVAHGSRDAQRYAVMAISNLAATERTREMLRERNTEAILRKCAQANSGDQMISQLVNRWALTNLKRNGTHVFNIPPPTGM